MSSYVFSSFLSHLHYVSHTYFLEKLSRKRGVHLEETVTEVSESGEYQGKAGVDYTNDLIAFQTKTLVAVFRWGEKRRKSHISHCSTL